MHLDAIDLKDFYACPLGVVVRRLLGARIRARFGELKGMSMFGLGFAAPYLALFKAEARPCGALMPVELGAIAWPEQGLASSVLVDETELPLDDEAADRLLLVHMLEWSEKSRELLRELWRVLKPNGAAADRRAQSPRACGRASIPRRSAMAARSAAASSPSS